MKNSEDFVKEIEKEFDREIQMPESLSKNNMIKMLKSRNIKQNKTRVRILPKVISAAAALVIIAAAAVSIGLRSEFVVVSPGFDNTGAAQETSTVPASAPQVQEQASETTASEKTNADEELLPVSELKVAKSEQDLKNHFLKLYAENKLDDYVDKASGTLESMIEFSADAVAEDFAVNENYMAAPTMAPGEAVTVAASSQSVSSSAPFGTTNLQVADVDEGDIIKNDGKYLYIVNSPGYARSSYTSKSTITIVNTETMTKIYSQGIKAEDDDKNMGIQDIYVNGDILTAICSYDAKTYAVVYGISERHAPAEIRRVDQDGTYVSSRMVDGILYTVTDYTVSGSSAEEIREKAIPTVNCDCISYTKCYVIDEDSTGYIVLSAFDTNKKDGEVSAISVLGNGFNVYSTSDNLYVYSSDYNSAIDDDYAIVCTDIYSFSIDGTNISHKATGRVKGDCINQYSLDEYGGNLRIATCYYDYRKNVDVSCVYVLDSNLKKIGEVFDLATDEQVKAVRFMGETGYVVTFRNTDPLFIIDFSDPTNPTVTGELKIPGYSTYIHPLDNNYLVGIGYDGTEENADINTVKVSVFDVSDKTNPKETDTFVIKDAYSLVNENPKAFFWYSQRNLIGIPVSHYDNNGNTVKSIQTLTVENGKISSHLGYIHYAGSSEEYYCYNSSFSYDYYYTELFRGTYIGNLLYTINNTDVIEHNLDTGDRTRTCVIAVKDTSNTDDSKITAVPESSEGNVIVATTSVTIS